MALAALVGFVIGCRKDCSDGFLAPTPLTAAVVFCLYVLFPAAGAWLWFGPALGLPPGGDPMTLRLGVDPVIQYVQRMIASDAERAVLSFVGAAVLLAGAVRLRPDSAAPTALPALNPWALLCMLIVGGLSYWAGKAGLQAGWLPPGLLAAVDVLPGLNALCLTYLTFMGRGQDRRVQLILVLAAAVFVLFHHQHAAKIVVFLGGVLCLHLLVHSEGRLRLTVLALSAAIPLIGIVYLGVKRDLVVWDELTWNLQRIAMSKLVERQAETVFCLHFALESPELGRSGDRPWYFLAALAPRAVWPDKPNLSNGADFARPYCGVVHPEHSHSASVTLLGEQAIMGGYAGMATGAAVLVLLSLSSSWAWRRSVAAQAVLTALMPWAIDFDQHLAIYLAQTVKLCLAMGAAALFLSWRGLPRCLTGSG